MVEVENRTAERIDADAVAACVTGVLEAEGAGDAEVAVIFVPADEMRALNREHRAVDEVTDVLAFPIDENAELPLGLPRLLGDVVICPEQAADQAADAGVPAGRELVELTVHGTLHLLGHDHERDGGAMLRRQDEICAGLGEIDWISA